MAIFRRLRARFDRRHWERDLAAEYAFHLEQCEAQLLRAGYDVAEAKRRALIVTGGFQQILQRHRDDHGLPHFETAARVIHRASRQLWRSPFVPVAAALCIALGASATAAVSTLISAAFLAPPPF